MKNLLTLNPPDPPITRDHAQGRHPRRRREGSRRRGRDEDRNSGSPATPARCQHQKWPVHSRKESKRPPDNAPGSAPTRTALLLFSGQQRSAFDVNTRCSQGGVSGDSARKTEQLCLCGRWRRYGALEHGGRWGARGGGREGPDGVVVRWSRDVGAL